MEDYAIPGLLAEDYYVLPGLLAEDYYVLPGLLTEDYYAIPDLLAGDYVLPDRNDSDRTEAASDGDTSPTNQGYDIHHTRSIHMDRTTSPDNTIPYTSWMARDRDWGSSVVA
ncbi:hypothetical protein [Dictyobacter aurantiacus]|uniref:hypothetical protein n=1 Tax=Dictyobacter aurantiacus TaxID=1936993 RepID=UPI00135CBF63|nr:hypothetical protein [Dictyobacter aurantiacus]